MLCLPTCTPVMSSRMYSISWKLHHLIHSFDRLMISISASGLKKLINLVTLAPSEVAHAQLFSNASSHEQAHPVVASRDVRLQVLLPCLHFFSCLQGSMSRRVLLCWCLVFSGYGRAIPILFSECLSQFGIGLFYPRVLCW